ncbi:hypothetical protein cyc_06273 [Cyclospora cayetanensis]|uniref:Uncharacterized protein n=1 Tax=Cyclospora cayetanensis TaxID=88456 RepID=A0A1D3D728_9EIME|nr:hypothetical protein cyc_06273 [Cyclospora cayetanensis]
MVTRVFPEEPIYEVQCIYHSAVEHIRVSSKDVRRCLAVPVDSWAAWQLALCRNIGDCLCASLCSYSAAAAIQPFPNYLLASPVSLDRLNEPPVPLSPFDAKLITPKEFAAVFLERQETALCNVMRLQGNHGLYVQPGDPDGSCTALCRGPTEGVTCSTKNRSEERRRLISLVVHPRLQLLGGARYFTLLSRRELVLRLLRLQKDTELLREQQQRQQALSTELTASPYAPFAGGTLGKSSSYDEKRIMPRFKEN